MERHVYATALRWDAERRGTLTSAGLAPLQVATPPQFPGGHAGIWSPEHLFVAAAEVCLMTTFLAIAENSKLVFDSYASEAEGVLEKTDDGYRITEIVLRPRVVVKDDASKDRAARLIEKAEKNCLISKSMNSRVKLEPTILVGG
jgi:peroxiredoxin-like protein